MVYWCSGVVVALARRGIPLCEAATIVPHLAGEGWAQEVPCRRHTFSLILTYLPAMRSDSELQIVTFRSEKRIGLLMQSDVEKSDGIKSDLRIRWPKSIILGPNSDDSAHPIVKSKMAHVKIELRRAWYSSLVQQQYEVHTQIGVAIDALDDEYNEPRCANAVAAPLRSQTRASCRSTRARNYSST